VSVEGSPSSSIARKGDAADIDERTSLLHGSISYVGGKCFIGHVPAVAPLFYKTNKINFYFKQKKTGTNSSGPAVTARFLISSNLQYFDLMGQCTFV